MSPTGTFETCQLHRAMSALRGNPEDMCSCGVLLNLDPKATSAMVHARPNYLNSYACKTRTGYLGAASSMPLARITAMASGPDRN
jgi:hypothetical protein